MPNRITKTWTATDFFAICRVADDSHREACGFGPNHGAGDSATGALIALLDRFATSCDCQDLARRLGCAPDPKSLAYAIRDCADECGQTPSATLVDFLQLVVL